MFSIGDLSKQLSIKVPTIRYYEKIGIMPEPTRTCGNQRRYSGVQFERLSFIKHARELGFSINAIESLLTLQNASSDSCEAIDDVASAHLQNVKTKIALLKAMETELSRMLSGCDDEGCYVIESLAKHELCTGEHS